MSVPFSGIMAIQILGTAAEMGLHDEESNVDRMRHIDYAICLSVLLARYIFIQNLLTLSVLMLLYIRSPHFSTSFSVDASVPRFQPPSTHPEIEDRRLH